MAAHRYWRITMIAGASSAYAFSEIQFRTTAGVSLPFSGGTASAADTFGSVPGTYDASHAADGNTSTLWSANGNVPPQWWAYDFGATSGNWRDVVEIVITARADAQPDQAPNRFLPEWSDDGTTWTGTTPITTAAWTTLAQVQTFTVVPGPAVSTTYTSWNFSDKSVATALSGGNRTATFSGSGGVRAVNGQTTGKFYFEVTGTTWSGLQADVAVANASAVLIGNSVSNIALVGDGGNIFSNGSFTSISLGTRANGDIIGVAVDLINRLIWFRVAPAGNWNASSSNDPATGVGGISISGISSSSVAVYPFVGSTTGIATLTANFGDTAFSGAVPSGYTAGWTGAGGGAAAVAQARAMVLA